MWSFLKQLFGETESEQSNPASLPEAAREGAERFAKWAGENCKREVPLALEGFPLCDDALNHYRSEKGGDEPPEQLANDLACFVGEATRREFGGEWRDHPVWGFNVETIGGHPHGKLLPMAVVERKWRQGNAFSLEEFAGSLSRRIEAEKNCRPLKFPLQKAFRKN